MIYRMWPIEGHMDCVPICDTGDFPASDSLDDTRNFPEGDVWNVPLDVNNGHIEPSGWYMGLHQCLSSLLDVGTWPWCEYGLPNVWYRLLTEEVVFVCKDNGNIYVCKFWCRNKYFYPSIVTLSSFVLVILIIHINMRLMNLRNIYCLYLKFCHLQWAMPTRNSTCAFL